MLNSKDSIVVGALLLSVCAATYGAPTAIQSDSIILSKSELLSSHTQVSNVSTAQESSLELLSTEAIDFSSSSFKLHSSTISSAKSLPAIPGAMFMVLVGFLCVSFVRDSRFWLAMLFGLASLGQAVFTALPHWAWKVRSKRQIKHYAPDATYASELKDSASLLDRLEGTPDSLRNTRYAIRNTGKAPRFVITWSWPCVSDAQALYLAIQTKKPVCFYPAFIFADLPRGPPIYKS
jgi:hypothetical protein